MSRPTIETLKAPSLDDFEVLGRAALAALPAEFLARAGEIEIRVDDFPTDEVLADLGLESEFDLLGLFRGTGLAQSGATLYTGQFPNMVWLYRRPLLDYWAEHEETLGHIVRHVLIHEMGHHFGLSDADMEAIEASAG